VRHNEIDDILRDTLRQEVAETTAGLVGLEERVAIELCERFPRLRISDWVRQLLAPTRGGRFGQLSVIGATAAICLLVGVFAANQFGFDGGPPRIRLTPSRAADGSQEVLFVLPALNATDVSVVGNFNSWEPTALSDDDNDGIWMASIPLPPGRYEYAFVIDGRWWGQDPLADEYVQSFGEYSSVRYVGGGDGA
jgi:hypothetical protein